MTAVFFDLVGVLLSAPSAAAKRRIEDALGTDRFWGDYEELRPQLLVDQVDERRYWNTVAARQGIELDDVAGVVAADWSAYLEEDAQAVQALHDLDFGIVANLPTGLSTIVRRQFDWLDEAGAVVLSCDIGLLNTDPRAYAVALDVMGASAKDSFYVSTSAPARAAAQEAGLTPVDTMEGLL